jgi:hypothetical protein
MEAYGKIISDIVDTINEFADKFALLAPKLDGYCKAAKSISSNLYNSKELIFRILCLIVTNKFKPHMRLLSDRNPELWQQVDFFGFDIKGFWLHPDLTKESKECIWNYVELFVRFCISAAELENIPTHIKTHDSLIKTLLSNSAMFQGPAVMALLRSQMGNLELE